MKFYKIQGYSMALIPFDDRDGFIWFDGQLVPWRDAKIHVITHGLHYGSAIFEGNVPMKAQSSKAKEHTSRLLTPPIFWECLFLFPKIKSMLQRRNPLKANHLTDAYIRPVAWRGSEQMGLLPKRLKPM